MIEHTATLHTETAPSRPALRVALAILFCMSAIYFFSFFQRVAVPGTIFDELQSDFQTTAGWIAGLSTLFLCIYGVMQFLSGLLNDRFGAVRIMLACGLLLTLGSLLFPLSHSLPALYATRALVGLGASLAFISIVKELDYLFDSHQFPQYLSIAMFLGYTGGLTGTFPFERAVSLWGWRHSLLGSGVLCALALVVAYVLFKKSGALARRVHAPSLLVFGVILRNRRSLALLLVAPANFAVYFLLQSTIGKKFLADYCGISGALATSFTFIMMLSTMGIVLASGFLTRLIGNRRKPLLITAVFIAFSGFACLILGLFAGFGSWWFLFCFILLALSNLGSPIGNILMKELNPPEAVGTATGLINGLCYLIAAILSSLSGYIMDHFRVGARLTATAIIYPREAYLTIFLICALISLGTVICSFFLRESHGLSVYVPEKTA